MFCVGTAPSRRQHDDDDAVSIFDFVGSIAIAKNRVAVCLQDQIAREPKSDDEREYFQAMAPQPKLFGSDAASKLLGIISAPKSKPAPGSKGAGLRKGSKSQEAEQSH